MGRVSNARQLLVDAAIELVWRQSYGAVGVDAICERAGVKKGSFYHFFKSKDDLLVAALEAHWQTRKAVLDTAFSAAVAPLERLERYFANVYDRQLALQKSCGRVLGCFHASVGTECIHESPAISAKVQEILTIYARYLETAIRDAQAAGVVRPGDAAAQAKALFAYVEGTLAQARIHNNLELIRQLARTALQFIGAAPHFGTDVGVLGSA